MTLTAIQSTQSIAELGDLVESYLRSIGQYELAEHESYDETAERLGDALMLEADRRWFKLCEAETLSNT